MADGSAEVMIISKQTGVVARMKVECGCWRMTGLGTKKAIADNVMRRSNQLPEGVTEIVKILRKPYRDCHVRLWTNLFDG
jgi:hypothetical protein